LKVFDRFEKERDKTIERRSSVPAYDYVLKLSHLFNILDARKAISVSERVRFTGEGKKVGKDVCRTLLEKKK
jgi:glycyl-tRNA synthetase alpha chain